MATIPSDRRSAAAAAAAVTGAPTQSTAAPSPEDVPQRGKLPRVQSDVSRSSESTNLSYGDLAAEGAFGTLQINPDAEGKDSPNRANARKGSEGTANTGQTSRSVFSARHSFCGTGTGTGTGTANDINSSTGNISFSNDAVGRAAKHLFSNAGSLVGSLNLNGSLNKDSGNSPAVGSGSGHVRRRSFQASLLSSIGSNAGGPASNNHNNNNSSTSSNNNPTAAASATTAPASATSNPGTSNTVFDVPEVFRHARSQSYSTGAFHAAGGGNSKEPLSSSFGTRSDALVRSLLGSRCSTPNVYAGGNPRSVSPSEPAGPTGKSLRVSNKRRTSRQFKLFSPSESTDEQGLLPQPSGSQGAASLLGSGEYAGAVNATNKSISRAYSDSNSNSNSNETSLSKLLVGTHIYYNQNVLHAANTPFADFTSEEILQGPSLRDVFNLKATTAPEEGGDEESHRGNEATQPHANSIGILQKERLSTLARRYLNLFLRFPAQKRQQRQQEPPEELNTENGTSPSLSISRNRSGRSLRHSRTHTSISRGENEALLSSRRETASNNSGTLFTLFKRGSTMTSPRSDTTSVAAAHHQDPGGASSTTPPAAPANSDSSRGSPVPSAVITQHLRRTSPSTYSLLAEANTPSKQPKPLAAATAVHHVESTANGSEFVSTGSDCNSGVPSSPLGRSGNATGTTLNSSATSSLNFTGTNSSHGVLVSTTSIKENTNIRENFNQRNKSKVQTQLATKETAGAAAAVGSAAQPKPLERHTVCVPGTRVRQPLACSTSDEDDDDEAHDENNDSVPTDTSSTPAAAPDSARNAAGASTNYITEYLLSINAIAGGNSGSHNGEDDDEDEEEEEEGGEKGKEEHGRTEQCTDGGGDANANHSIIELVDWEAWPKRIITTEEEHRAVIDDREALARRLMFNVFNERSDALFMSALRIPIKGARLPPVLRSPDGSCTGGGLAISEAEAALQQLRARATEEDEEDEWFFSNAILFGNTGDIQNNDTQSGTFHNKTGTSNSSMRRFVETRALELQDTDNKLFFSSNDHDISMNGSGCTPPKETAAGSNSSSGVALHELTAAQLEQMSRRANADGRHSTGTLDNAGNSNSDDGIQDRFNCTLTPSNVVERVDTAIAGTKAAS